MRPGYDLESLFARMAESMANATLRLDKGSRERLAALEGRSIQVESTGPAQVFSVRVCDGRIEVTPGPVDSPDAVVRGRFQGLAAWLAAPDGSAAERVEIDGDPAVPAELAELFRALAPQGLPLPFRGEDLVGAVELAGAVIGSAAEGAARAWRQVSKGAFVSRDRFGDAREDIEALRADIGNLTARVATLETARGGAEEGEAGQPAPGDGSQHESAAAPPPQDEPR